MFRTPRSRCWPPRLRPAMAPPCRRAYRDSPKAGLVWGRSSGASWGGVGCVGRATGRGRLTRTAGNGFPQRGIGTPGRECQQRRWLRRQLGSSDGVPVDGLRSGLVCSGQDRFLGLLPLLLCIVVVCLLCFCCGCACFLPFDLGSVAILAPSSAQTQRGYTAYRPPQDLPHHRRTRDRYVVVGIVLEPPLGARRGAANTPAASTHASHHATAEADANKLALGYADTGTLAHAGTHACTHTSAHAGTHATAHASTDRDD